MRQFAIRFQLPLILTAVFVCSVLLNSEWIYNATGWVDGWAYLGAKIHPIHMRQVYPEHPLGDLLPMLLPPAPLYALFSPFVANFIYRWGCFVLAGQLMFRTVEREFGTRSAVLTTTLFLASKDFLSATGSDYALGNVMIYYLLTIFLMLGSVAKEDLPRPVTEAARERRWLFLAGVAFAMCVSTAFLSSVYCVPLAVLYLGKRRLKDGRFQVTAVKNTLFPTLGFISGVLLLCATHFTYTGNFVYFQGTFDKVTRYLSTGRASSSISYAKDWLAIPIYTLASLAALCLHRRTRELVRGMPLVIAMGSLSGLAMLIYLQVARNQASVSDPYYFSQTLPLTFVAMAGVLIRPWADGLSRKAFGRGAILLAALNLAWFWYSTITPRHTFFMAEARPWTALLVAVVMAGLILLRKPALALAAIASLVMMINRNPQLADELFPERGRTADVPTRQVAMQLSMDWLKMMERVDPERKGFLWYDSAGEKSPRVMLASVSHFWQLRVYNEHYPQLDIQIGEHPTIMPEQLVRQPLIVMSDDRTTLDQARRSLRDRGVDSRCESMGDFASGGKKFFEVVRCECKLVARNRS